MEIRGRNGEDILLPASPRSKKSFPRLTRPASSFLFCVPAPPRPENSSPRPAPPRFFKVFLSTVLAPKVATERIFYSPPCPAPSLVSIFHPRPASPRQKWSPPRFPAPFRSLMESHLTDLFELQHHHPNQMMMNMNNKKKQRWWEKKWSTINKYFKFFSSSNNICCTTT